MGGIKRRLHVALARCMNAEQMRQDHRAPRLVEGRHRIEPVTEAADDCLRVALEGVSRGTRRPAAIAHQRQRQVPVIERRKGLDAARLQAVDQLVVEVEPLLVDRPGAVRHDAWPGDRESIGRNAHVLDEVEVFFPAVIMIAGDIAIVPLINPARHIGKGIPDAGLAPVFLRRALDLIGGRGNPENEVAGETGCKGLGVHGNALSEFRL